jgi:hypothetical protein
VNRIGASARVLQRRRAAPAARQHHVERAEDDDDERVARGVIAPAARSESAIASGFSGQVSHVTSRAASGVSSSSGTQTTTNTT